MSNSPLPPLAPLAVFGPPDAIPSELPVETRVHHLPFGGMTWENFERLCHRLTALDGDVEHCARYGRQGHAQEGIDIFARQVDGRYHCLQAKRHRSYDATKLRDAVDLFLAGSWADRATRFTIAVQALLDSPAVQEEIERQAARLKERGIKFATLDGEQLTDRLRSHPIIVDDFFGRSWVTALLGADAARKLGARLDGAMFARVRDQLARVYAAQFQSVDPGSFGSIGDQEGRPALTLLERFVKPDMLLRETTRLTEQEDLPPIEAERNAKASMTRPHAKRREGSRPTEAPANGRVRRMQLAEWFGDSRRMVVLGEAGCGKSTLLRVIALDLLHSQVHFPEIAKHWGEHIPVYVPFARWTSHVARVNNPIGIKEIVRRTLEHLLTASIADILDRALDDGRVLLLVDGLDEWSNEQAARTTLSLLVTTVEAHDVPVVACGRPRGLNRIGSLPAAWKRGTVAPLSVDQQRAIAQRWFQRHAAGEADAAGMSEANLRTSRFMAELARDGNLNSLAVVPLIFIGLVTLALRGQILPRTKNDIYDQLVRVLLEIHPDRRATASGDTESRFRHATDPDQRRAAIAKLAFAVREQTGGAGMSVSSAREILRTFLSSPQGFDLAEAEAALAAGEILSVNAETQGLIVEKAPGEVGFLHASFEEYLSAEHIGGWPFKEIEEFVRARAGEGRWRNVITNLLGYVQRRDEFDRLVGFIEAHDPDELASMNRIALLGDIAFSAAIRSPTTAKRLAVATMDRVELEDWLPARREALASVLKGLPDPALKGEIEQRLERWLPGRGHYWRGSLVAAFGSWTATDRLQRHLLQAMRDESHHVQRAAATAYAEVFAPSPSACKALLDALACTCNLESAVAMLESLAHGWPDVPEAAPLFEKAWNSHQGDLCLVGILGLAAIGKVSAETRDAVLRGQNWRSDVSYEYRELAVRMLIRRWPNDPALVSSALARASDRMNSLWESGPAIRYLLASSVDQPDVRKWILSELGSDFPFNSASIDGGVWAEVARFAEADSQIRAAANAYWCKSENRHLHIFRLPGYVAKIADPAVAGFLIETLRDAKSPMDRYWALNCLLAGWDRSDAGIKEAIDALAVADDDEMCDLVAFLPEIMRDKAAARSRLIRMGERTDVRRDMLTEGLVRCGCDSGDSDAVAAILAVPRQLVGSIDGFEALLRGFGDHASVRALARERFQEADSPLAAIAARYPDDPEFSDLLFDASAPLPVDLRTQIVEVAAMGAAGTALEGVLCRAMVESDPDLRARMVVARHRELPLEARVEAQATLLSEAVAVGGDFESVRAAALAGLATIGALPALAALEEGGKPVALFTHAYGADRIASVERLVCEQYAEFEAAFGTSLSERFDVFGARGQLGEILAAAPGASPASRAAFLAIAERGQMPLTPEALRALAAERPRSDLLLSRCWDVLKIRGHTHASATVNAEVGVILREHFPNNPEVRQRLVEVYNNSMSASTAIPLAVYAPDSKELPHLTEYGALGTDFGDWATTMHVAARRSNSAAFCELLEATVTRRRRSEFDAQQIANMAVVERLQRDPELASLLTSKIQASANPSVGGSFARYLAAVGNLSLEGRSRTLELLRATSKDQSLPVAGYDAIADQWRAVRATLLDALWSGLELA